MPRPGLVKKLVPDMCSQAAPYPTQIRMGLFHCGFTLEAVEEVRPSEEMPEMPGMRDELRRPMMLLVRGKKGSLRA